MGPACLWAKLKLGLPLGRFLHLSQAPCHPRRSLAPYGTVGLFLLAGLRLGKVVSDRDDGLMGPPGVLLCLFPVQLFLGRGELLGLKKIVDLIEDLVEKVHRCRCSRPARASAFTLVLGLAFPLLGQGVLLPVRPSQSSSEPGIQVLTRRATIQLTRAAALPVRSPPLAAALTSGAIYFHCR